MQRIRRGLRGAAGVVQRVLGSCQLGVGAVHAVLGGLHAPFGVAQYGGFHFERTTLVR